jgi:hypothetical protein
MFCYIVTFEVPDSTRVAAVKESLTKSFSGQCKLTDSSWAIITEKKATEVRDILNKCLAPGDRLYVFRSGTEGAWIQALSDKHSDWLKRYL